MQTTTGQSVVCQYCTSCLPQYFMLVSPLVCTEYNLTTKQGFGPIIDVTITLWCTECWSSVVASGVYHCTSARSTSRTHSTESHVQRFGALCSSTVSNQHTWDYCNSSTASKKEQFWQTKRAMHFQSNGVRNKGIHCPLYSSTQCCNIHWKVIWSGGRRNEKASSWATKQKTAWRTWDLLTTYYSSPLRWRSYAKCSVSSRPAQKLRVWEFTPTKQKFSATRTKWKLKRLQLTTSKSRSWRKVTVHDYLDKKSRSRNKKLKRSKTDWKQRGQRSTNTARGWRQSYTLGKRSLSKIRKLKRSKTGWKQRGQRFINIARNWHRKITDSVTDSVSSIWWSHRRWLMQVEHGH